MTIELEYGKTFQYSAFMEFSFLRIALQRLGTNRSTSSIWVESQFLTRIFLLPTQW
jgi:hypothetical protein